MNIYSKNVNCIMMILLAIIATQSVAIAHPSDGYPTEDLHPYYGTDRFGLNPENDVNDIYFVQPLPDPTTLTSAEKYILTGLTQDGPEHMRQPYYIAVSDAVFGYYLNTGEMPSAITPEVLKELEPDPENISPDRLERMKSPITGEYPRIDASTFTPGGFYIRPLTEDEMAYIGNQTEGLKELWFDGVQRDPVTGEEREVDLIGDAVLYVRVYGEREVILTTLYFVNVDAR